MSHSYGEVWGMDGRKLGDFEYDGTSDVALARVHSDRDGVRKSWRGDNWRDCTCGKASEAVILYTTYAFGYHWPGRWCPRCMAITEGHEPEGSVDGRPFVVAGGGE